MYWGFFGMFFSFFFLFFFPGVYFAFSFFLGGELG